MRRAEEPRQKLTTSHSEATYVPSESSQEKSSHSVKFHVELIPASFLPASSLSAVTFLGRWVCPFHGLRRSHTPLRIIMTSNRALSAGHDFLGREAVARARRAPVGPL